MDNYLLLFAVHKSRHQALGLINAVQAAIVAAVCARLRAQHGL